MKAQGFIGYAGWSIPREEKSLFPDVGTHLERYAAVFSAVELNSSFYRPHRLATYSRWAASVPAGFRFSVKIPKEITHAKRLENVEDPLTRFLDEASGLGEKLGCLLVQLPPSLSFDPKIASAFFEAITAATKVPIVVEPRHPSWFQASVGSILIGYQIARVAADPFVVPDANEPGGWSDLAYYRLHGSPRIYYSAYSEAFIRAQAQCIKSRLAAADSVWCIFDNTALGAATSNARQLQRELALP